MMNGGKSSIQDTNTMNIKPSRYLVWNGSWMQVMAIWLCMVCALLMIGPRAAYAEGSVNLSANGGKRAITEWRTSLYGNLLPRRTLLKVYANAGEVINLGSSAAGVASGTTTGDIVVWTPGQITAPLTVALPTPAFSCKTAQPANGKLDSRAKEVAGPLPNAGGYTPCTYTAPTTGTYNVAFYGPLGGSSDSDGNAGTIAVPIVDRYQGSGVSMWDITVRNSAGTTYSGRVFTDYLAQLSGGNGPTYRIYSTLYALTADGFKYQIDLRGLDPWGFILYGNTVGYLHPDNITPLYHDVVNVFGTPSGGAKLSAPTGLLFFNPPDAGLPASIAPTPLTPSLTGIQFAGSAGGINSVLGTGGNFVYSGNVGGVAEVVITPNPGSDLAACNTATYDASLATNRVIRAALPGGQQNLAWDGKDNNGTNVPLSYPGNSGKGYCFKATLHAGEYHFPLLDAENSMLGGPTITLLNAPGGVCPLATCRTAFFDDRGYKTTSGVTVGTIGAVLSGNGPPPSPYNSLTGFDTASTTIRKYGNDASGFGDVKGLDLWTYFPSQDIVGQLYVQPAGTQDLAISKTHSGDFAIGVNNTYTIAVRNVGSLAISNLITVTDPVPAGLTLVSAAGTGWNCTGTSGQNVNCTITPSSLAAGASLNNITVTVNPQASAATGTDLVNTATLANSGDTNAVNNSASNPTTITSADLAVTKSASPTTPAEGATVTYTVTVTNNGPSTADSVSVADAIPAGLTLVSATPTQGSYASGVWTVGTLLKSATATLALAATVNTGQSGQTIGNTATVSGGPYDYASGNNTASASLSVPTTVLTGIVTDQKTGSPLAGVSVQVTDSAAHVYTVTTDGDGRYTVTGSPANPLAAGTATVSVSTPGYVTATASPTVAAGSSATQNQALTPLSLSGTLTDLGDGVPIVGATVTLTQGALTCTTTTTAGGAYSFTHSAGCLLVAGAATVTATQTGYATASASPTILATGPTTQNLQAGTVDLVITKTDGVVTVQAGDVLNYVLTVANNGSIAAEAVTLKDTFPSTCLNFTSDNSGITKTGTGTSADPYTWVKSGSLAPDASWSFTITASVKTDLSGCTTGIVNYAKVFTTSPENNGPNNEVSDIDTVAQAPDLVITKTDGVTQVQAGQTLTYTIAYQNTGNNTATAVTIVDTLQNGVEIDAAQLSGNTYSGSTPSSTYTAPSGDQPGTLTWNIVGGLAVSGTGSITLGLKVKSDVAPSSVVANRVAITHNPGDGTDPNPGNNTATDSDPVIAPAIVLEKHVSNPGPTYVGQAIGYSIAWRNAGAALAKTVTITDTLPANTTLVGGSITDGGTESSGVITWTLGDQAAGASSSVGFQVIPNTSAGGATQTAPTLTTETGSGSVTVTSSTTPLALPYCKTALAGTIAVTNGSAAVTGTDTAFATELAAGNRIAIAGALYRVLAVTDATHLTLTGAYAGTTGSGISATNATCLALMNRYQGTDGTPPTGWNDNPRLTLFDDSAWTQAGEAEPEYPYWTQPTNLSAEWVAPNKDGHTEGNFTFFRQGFCLPLNATGLSARLELASDDVSTIFLNGSGLGQQIGAGGANAFAGDTAIQAGMNVLAVQLLNNRHGGHPFPTCAGCDHIGLLFNLNADYSGLRPFVAAPTAARLSETLSFAADPQVLGGRAPFQYKFEFGDGTTIDYQGTATQTHGYSTAGTYTATVTARDAYGCTGSDQIVVTVLSATGNLLPNAASASYQDVGAHPFTASSGAGLDLDEAADLAMAKTVTSGGTVPGQGVTYQVVVTNNGPSAVTGATVTDTVPATVTGVTWTCSATGGGACAHASGSGNALAETVDLPASATATYTIAGTVSPSATGTLANTATVAPPAGVTDLVSGNDSATASTSLTTTLDLSITKTSSPANALPGGTITYTITVGNAGPGDAVGARVADTLPDEIGLVTWNCSASTGSSCAASGTVRIDDTVNVKSGGTLTYTLEGVLDPSAVAPVQNTATVTPPAGVTDTTPGNNTATDTNTPTQIALTGVVRVNGTVQAGATVTLVDNAGHSYTTTTNGSGVYTFASTEANPLAIGLATVTATYSDYVPKVETKTLTAGANTQDLSIQSTELDLSVSLGSNPTPFVAGQPFTYTIVVSHLSGPPDGANTRVQSTLPAALSAFAWTCVADAGASCGTASGTGNIDALVALPLGTKVTYTVTGTVPSGTTGTLTTTATVTAPEGFTDPNTANNAASDSNPPIATYALLDRFQAQGYGDGILVEWTTQSELGTAGFELVRKNADGTFESLHDALIGGQSAAGEGGQYRFLDAPAAPGVAVTYRLTEVETNGNRREVGQYSVTPLGQPEAAQASQATNKSESLTPGRPNFTPRPLTQEETGRLQARRAEQALAAEWGQPGQSLGAANIAAGPSNRAAIGVRATGLYQVSASALALALDWPEGKVKGLIQAGQLRLTNQGLDVAWRAAAKGQGVLFFGEASRGIYDLENVYVVGQGAGTRMTETRVLAKGAPGVDSFPATVTAEENRFAGTVMAKDPEEDFWFWASFMNGGAACGPEKFLGCGSRAFALEAPGASGTGTARLRLWLRGVSALAPNPDHQVGVAVNGTPVGDGQWDGLTDYLLELPVAGSLLRADGHNQVQVQARVVAGVANNYFYLDRLALEYPRYYQADQNTLTVTGNAGQLLVAGGFSSSAIQTFDLTNPRLPRAVIGTKVEAGVGGYQASLVPASATTPYLLVAEGAIRAPARVRPLETTGLAGTKGFPYLVIAPRDFHDEASQPVQRLLSLRASQGLSGRFVSLQALYDEYGGGQKTPHAIRRFLAEALSTWQVPPAYVLLGGKGTYDPKDLLGYGTDRLPVLMALTPNSGVIAADQRFVDVDGDSLGDLALGRLPATTAAEFAGMVDKLIAYEDGGPSAVPYAILLADGPDAGGNYTANSETSADRLLEAGLADTAVQRLYLERMTATAARGALLAGLKNGADLLNYFGHAGVIALDHGLLSATDAAQLAGQGQLPVMLGMTCLMNRFELPQQISLGEALLRNPAGGAAAVWSSGGYSYDIKANALNDAFLEALLQQRVPRLGDAIQAALAGTAQSLGPATAPGIYNLLGDPATLNPMY